MENPRTFRIDRGIGQYDFNDYYAVLGLPLTAESSLVRRRYLLIAKCLHPDIHGRSSTEKEVATQYLSKLVNPAYNVLSQERERTEYSAILKLLGKRLMKRNQKFLPQSNIAQQYLVSSKDFNYEQTVHDIAKAQYQDLGKALEQTGLLSELNLVHILLQEGYKPVQSTPITSSSSYMSSTRPDGDDTRIQTGNTAVTRPSSSGNTSVNNTGANRSNSSYSSAGSSYQMRSESQTPLRNNINTTNTSSNTSAKSTNQASNSSQASNKSNAADGSITQYIRQAENYINQKLWASALKELRSAIQVDCNNSKCHALLGFVYMNQKLSGMAKVSFLQALKLNPDEPIAKQYIDQVSGTNSGGTNASKTDPKAKNDKKGGFFGWLGGG
ncbi:J domain-containing protein [Pseudanabaena sp. BC1403]|uniref:J domain-containing protein n=1 Tax=Pseudanabaena sp. BC1403 TaxID=2043171 RepID=UPI000CD9C09F|nr:J domain-containing protein [Pseudanabaena sp. BC1403]